MYDLDVARYFIELDGVDGVATEAEFASVADARNAAIVLLGMHLQQHPTFAYQRHWRVDVKDHAHRLLLHVIVATVEAPEPINWASYEQR